MPKGHTTGNEQKRAARKTKARERRVKRANNVLQNNLSAEAKAKRYGDVPK